MIVMFLMLRTSTSFVISNMSNWHLQYITLLSSYLEISTYRDPKYIGRGLTLIQKKRSLTWVVVRIRFVIFKLREYNIYI